MPSSKSEFKDLYNIDPSTYTAGFKNPRCKTKPLPGTRVMMSNNAVIKPTLGGVENIEYKGNAVLNANK